MSIYGNQRVGKKASDECLKYYLNKFREEFRNNENARRAELKAKESPK